MMNKSEIEELKKHCISIRREILGLCYKASPSNTHLGGCMSLVEVLAVLYFKASNIADIYQSEKSWKKRDRVIMSKGHAGIALYAVLRQVGIINDDDIDRGIRGEDSLLFRHPKKNIEKAIECSSGSLGMGLGYAVGLCKAFKLRGESNHVYVILGDGECEEGNIWESAMYASHHQLNNLTIIVDKNNLQLDGATKDIVQMNNLAERWKSFGFNVFEVNGHDVEEIYDAFVCDGDRPKVIIANTIKGKGVSFAENKVEWHDNQVNQELYEKALSELSADYILPPKRQIKEHYKEETECSKNIEFVYGKDCIEEIYTKTPKDIIGIISGQIAQIDSKYALLYADCGKRINLEYFEKVYPMSAHEMGIAEQNQVCVAAALADEGYNVFATAYAPFITARVLDQIRAFLGYMESPVKLIGLSAGLALGDLGATHTALEDVANIRSIPNMIIVSPADSLEVVKTMEALANYKGSAYLRMTEPFSDVKLYGKNYEFELGKAIVLNEGDDIAIISCGTVLTEVVKASEVLKKKGISCKVINMHTIKPIDKAMLDVIKNYRLIVCVEEHSVIGGLGSAVAEYLSEMQIHAPLIRIGIEDRYYKADIPSELRKRAGLLCDDIVRRIEENL